MDERRKRGIGRSTLKCPIKTVTLQRLLHCPPAALPRLSQLRAFSASNHQRAPHGAMPQAFKVRAVGAEMNPQLTVEFLVRTAMFKNGMRPVHPGEVLREDYLIPLGLTANALAQALNVPAPRINWRHRGYGYATGALFWWRRALGFTCKPRMTCVLLRFKMPNALSAR